MRVLPFFVVLVVVVASLAGPARAAAPNDLSPVAEGGYSTLNSTYHVVDQSLGEGMTCYAGCDWNPDSPGSDNGVWRSGGADTDADAGSSLAFSSNFPSTMGLPCDGYSGDFSDFTAEPGHTQGWVGFERYELDLDTFEPNGFAPTHWSLTFNFLGNNTRAADVCLLVYSYDPAFSKTYIFSGTSFSVGAHTVGSSLDGSTRVLVGFVFLYAVAGASSPIAVSISNFEAGVASAPSSPPIDPGVGFAFGLGGLLFIMSVVFLALGVVFGRRKSL